MLTTVINPGNAFLRLFKIANARNETASVGLQYRMAVTLDDVELWMVKSESDEVMIVKKGFGEDDEVWRIGRKIR